MAPVVVHEQIALWVLFPETVQRMLSNALNLQMLVAVGVNGQAIPIDAGRENCFHDKHRGERAGFGA